MAFKNAKQFDQAKEAYLKEAEYHTENKAYPFLHRYDHLISENIGSYNVYTNAFVLIGDISRVTMYTRTYMANGPY